ncbi:MAG TPA: c-type cytochrome [Thermodesulfobacteriota bacterium]|nr:c-type cytochrome [Thermodesulfobacteriota bacterium]
MNVLLLVAIFLTLSLALVLAYRGWKEDHALHHSDRKGGTEIIADITVNLSGIPYREHCMTCHPQGRAAKLPGQPMVSSKHPEIIPHSMDDLGCTGCHLGEGMARDPIISHGRVGVEARKVLAGEGVQASCYRCHELKPLPGAEKAWEGFQLFSANACDTCHNVDGLTGGIYGPDLSAVGSSLSLRQIQDSIIDPKADPENSIMPKFSLSPDQVKAISYFLKSRMKESPYETPMVKMVRIKKQMQTTGKGPEKISHKAGEILREKKCLTCHKFQKEDGQIAPDLSYMAYMRDKNYIKDFLYSPGRRIPGAIMPSISLTREEEEEIVRSLQEKNIENHPYGMNPKHLYMMLCQRCHAAQGDGLGMIQPNLANFPRAFWKNGQFFRRIPDERIIKSIEKGIPGTSMPPYGELLEHETVNLIVDLLFREFIRADRKDKSPAPTLPQKPVSILTREKGRKEFTKYCSSCHGIAGNGKGPEYLKYLPRPRDLTNQPYFLSLTDERIALSVYYGVPGTAMHPLEGKISPESLWSFVNTIRELSKSHGKSSKSTLRLSQGGTGEFDFGVSPRADLGPKAQSNAQG